MTKEQDIAFSLAFSGCSALAFLLLFGFALLKTARRFGKGEAVPVLAFRIPLPLREVAGRLSKVSAELPDLPKNARSLVGFLAREDLALLYYPSVMKSDEELVSRIAGFEGAALLWEGNLGETLVLFLAGPIPGISPVRSLRLAALRRAARKLMGELRRMTGIPFEEQPVEEAGRLHARLRNEGWGLGRRARAVERALVLRTFPLTPQAALQGLLAGALAAFSALLLAALLADRLGRQGSTAFFFPVMALLGVITGVIWFGFLATMERTRVAVISFEAPDPESLRDAVGLPWWAVPLMAASGPLAVLIAAAGGRDGELLAVFLPCLGPAALATALLVLTEARGRKEVGSR
ncbi:hypothetical protein [Thermoflexus sp.]|jgi:hypothetical protein|uniref:hypothetical protein n=1 Tax=Thermoflexus sp. TaxID=1969742 RepID=UPI003C12AA79